MAKHIVLALKLTLSVGLIFLLMPRLDAARLGDLLVHPSTLMGILLAVAALWAQSALAAVRQIDLVALLKGRMAFWRSLKVWFAGLFVSQVLVTFVAGDVVRAMQFARSGMARRVAGQAVVLDRALGLVMLLIMVLAATPFVLPLVVDRGARLSVLILNVGCAAGILTFVLGGFLDSFVRRLPFDVLRYRPVSVLIDLLSVSRFLKLDVSRSLRIAGLSIVMHGLNIVAMLVIAWSLGVTVPTILFAAVSLPALLLSMLPISFAGWGVREASMVTGLSLLHVPADIALTISVAFGLSMILASLPGLPALLINRSAKSDHAGFAIAAAK